MSERSSWCLYQSFISPGITPDEINPRVTVPGPQGRLSLRVPDPRQAHNNTDLSRQPPTQYRSEAHLMLLPRCGIRHCVIWGAWDSPAGHFPSPLRYRRRPRQRRPCAGSISREARVHRTDWISRQFTHDHRTLACRCPLRPCGHPKLQITRRIVVHRSPARTVRSARWLL